MTSRLIPGVIVRALPARVVVCSLWGLAHGRLQMGRDQGTPERQRSAKGRAPGCAVPFTCDYSKRIVKEQPPFPGRRRNTGITKASYVARAHQAGYPNSPSIRVASRLYSPSGLFSDFSPNDP